MPTMQQIIDEIKTHRDLFDLTKQNLGDNMAQGAANGIKAAMDLELDSDLVPWLDLETVYEAWKTLHYPGRPIAVLMGHMKQLHQLVGILYVQPNLMIQTYGTDPEAWLLAMWFQDPVSWKNQPPRKFYEFNTYALVEVDLVVTNHFSAMTP